MIRLPMTTRLVTSAILQRRRGMLDGIVTNLLSIDAGNNPQLLNLQSSKKK